MALVAAFALVAACGGGDGPSGPPKIVQVVVTAPVAQLEVGSTLLLSASLRDKKGNELTGRTVTWQTSSQSIATVDNGGVVTGVGPGMVQIIATAETVSGSTTIAVVPVPVVTVVINERTPAVRQGESAQLTAVALDAIGRVLSGRSITWSSASPAIATASATGLVAGILPGSAYIRAESEGKVDSVLFRVKGLNGPTVSGTAPSNWAPGTAASVTGTNFSTDPTSDEVYVNGTRVQLTAATATTLSFTVPSALSLPCSPTGPIPVIVVVNGDSVTSSANLTMATPRTLAVGESLLLTTQDQIECNEFSVTGGKYLVTAFNYAPLPSTRASFQLVGASRSASLANQSMRGITDVQPQTPSFGPLAMQVAPSIDERTAQTHLAAMEMNRQLLQRRGSPRQALQSRRNRALRGMQSVSPTARTAFAGPFASTTPVAPPQVGDTVSKRMFHTYGNYSTFDVVQFKVVYSGPKLVIMEDLANPLAGTLDAEFQKLGQEFDQEMYPFVLYFGDPLVLDPLLDNNGVAIALISKRVNEYTINGSAGGLLGFVTLCDFFPQTDPNPDNACPPSNEGEYFYAIAPNPGGTVGAWTVEQWLRYVRSTMAHEMKHVVMFAERISRDASFTEEPWLEEATAQQSSELWSRFKYGPFGWKANITWAQGPRCDYASTSASCPDPFEGILHHFGWLYTHYNANEGKSILTQAGFPSDPVIYGSSWSFARWITDFYGAADEKTFLRSLVQQKDDRGVNNVELRTGHPFSELFGLWTMASLADDYPGAVINDPKLQLASWNSRDIFSSMSQFLVTGNPPHPAFPRVFPLNVRTPAFGTFPDFVRNVVSLQGGSFAAWEITGVETFPQVLGLRALNGGVPPANIGMVVLRVQ